MTSIFAGNLPHDLGESQLRQAFEQFGRVASARIATDPGTRRSRGFGFVRMPVLDDADEAITRLSGASIGGRTLTVNEAREDRPNVSCNGEQVFNRGRARDRSAAILGN